MDNSLSSAGSFAHLVRLLIHQPRNVDDQKAALRAVLAALRGSPARLTSQGSALDTAGAVISPDQPGMGEVIERLSAHGILTVHLDRSPAPSEVLALARMLALEPSSDADSLAIMERLEALTGVTVRVERAPPAAAPAALEQFAVLVEQATRTGRTLDAARSASELLDREPKLGGAEERKEFEFALRRMAKPAILRPIARLIAEGGAAASLAERILRRLGQDGVDAVVDRLTASKSPGERHVYRAALARMPHTRAALAQMLSDSRWHVARDAASLLGDMKAADAEQPIAELLLHDDERVRRAATHALGRIGSEAAWAAVARALQDPVRGVRLEAVAALAGRGDGRAASTLAAAITAELDRHVQLAILGALGRLATPEAVQALVRAADGTGGPLTARGNTSLRVAAVQALGVMRSPAALAALALLSHGRDKEVKDAAARMLLLVRSTAA